MKNALKKIWYLFFRKSPGETAADIIYPVLPAFVKKKCIEQYFNRTGFIGKLTNIISAKLEAEYFRLEDKTLRRKNRELFWGAQYGKSWHDIERNKYGSIEEYSLTDSFIKFRLPLVDMIRGGDFVSVCELGTGNGLFIKYMQSVFPGAQLYGFDLNREIIEDNKRIYHESNIEFVADPDNGYILKRLPENSLVFAAGTFECFTQNELTDFFKALKNTGKKITIALSEPFDLDLTVTTDSETRGGTLFSHAYEKILTDLKYQITNKLYLKRKDTDRIDNYVILTATT